MALTNCFWTQAKQQTAQQVSTPSVNKASRAETRLEQQLTSLNDTRLRTLTPRTPNQFLRGGKDVQR